MVLAGLAFGLLSGLVHVRLKVPSFVATLATGGVVAGLALLAARGRAITIDEVGRGYAGWIDATVLGLPAVVGIAVLVGLLAFVGLHYTRFGRHTVAVGAGEPAARAAGVDVGRTKIMAFGISGTLAAVAGILLAARLSSGSPTLANQLMLPAIAAVIVGGTAITGGLGNVGRTAVGALIISIVRIGMTFVGRQHLRRERRLRRHADRRRRGHHRPQQDPDHQVTGGALHPGLRPLCLVTRLCGNRSDWTYAKASDETDGANR